jgi:hypothetical protein
MRQMMALVARSMMPVLHVRREEEVFKLSFAAGSDARVSGIDFTCFTGTKVQILTEAFLTNKTKLARYSINMI